MTDRIANSDFLTELKRRMGVTNKAPSCSNCKYLEEYDRTRPPQCHANAAFPFMVQADWYCKKHIPSQPMEDDE